MLALGPQVRTAAPRPYCSRAASVQHPEAPGTSADVGLDIRPVRCWDVSSHFLLLGLGETPTPVHVSLHSVRPQLVDARPSGGAQHGGLTLKHLLGTCEQQGSCVTAHVLWNCGTGTLSQKIRSWTGTVPRGGSSPSV